MRRKERNERRAEDQKSKHEIDVWPDVPMYGLYEMTMMMRMRMVGEMYTTLR